VSPATGTNWDEAAWRAEREAVRSLAEADHCRENGELAEAEKSYRQALSAKPDYVEPIIVLGSLLMEAGDTDAAIHVIARLVELDSDSAQAHNYLGLARYQAEDWEGARESFQRVLELNPDHVEGLVNLSVLDWERERPEEALDYLERAGAIDPANRDVIINTGLMQLHTGAVEAAVDLLDEYARQHPADVGVADMVLDILVQLDRVEEAREVAQRILEMDPEHPKARSLMDGNEPNGA
jgi:tetratricopeptide (TPR) repeat protein